MIIALLTDFGTRDHFVGAVKGVILSIDPDVTIVDITHEIDPQNVASAAYVLRSCYKEFPAATIFLCVVDPGVGSDRRAVIVEAGERIFVGPDNGIFSYVLALAARVTSIENDRFFRKPVCSTFHGRDIFAPVAANLSLRSKTAEFGPVIIDPVILPDLHPKAISENTLEASIIHIDRFGNLVTNISVDEAKSMLELEIGGRRIVERRDTYSGAESGQPFSISGSADFIEIAVDRGSAANVLHARVGTPVLMRLI